MTRSFLGTDELKRALALLGERVGGYDDIEVLIVGGFAGKLAGQLPLERSTVDCDVMVYDPESAFGQVEHEAHQVGKELGLPPQWLNCASRGFAYLLPDGWKTRRQHLGDFGLLHVYYVARVDLIALKVLAGRAIDQADLQQLNPTPEEAMLVRSHVASLESRGRINADHAEEARQILAAVEVKP